MIVVCDFRVDCKLGEVYFCVAGLNHHEAYCATAELQDGVVTADVESKKGRCSLPDEPLSSGSEPH